MISHIWPSKSKIRHDEDWRKKNHPPVASMPIKDGENVPVEYKVHTKIEELFGFKAPIKWQNTMIFIFLHMGTLYNFYSINIFENIMTLVWSILIWGMQSIGVTAGVHRLWSHRAYKAKFPLRVLLLIFHNMAGQYKITDWVRDHRVHHKYTDTDADPHNTNRGFFFSHIGWLMIERHPELVKRTRQVDMSDLLADPVVVFDDKYSWLLTLIFCFVLPIVVPVYAWNETWMRSIQIQLFYRYVFCIHCTFTINSLSHMFGSKPYDVSINPTNNKLVSFLAYGEGWHNYHHVFPWDYKAAELGDYKLNIATMFIDFFAKIGWAYDLKQPSQQLVMSVVMKRGDGSHHMWNFIPHPDSKIEDFGTRSQSLLEKFEKLDVEKLS